MYTYQIWPFREFTESKEKQCYHDPVNKLRNHKLTKLIIQVNWSPFLGSIPWRLDHCSMPRRSIRTTNSEFTISNGKLHTQYNTPCPKKSCKIQVLWKTNPQTIDKCNKEHLCFIPFITFKFVYFFFRVNLKGIMDVTI